MELPSQAQLLRIHVTQGDKFNNKPLHEVIIAEARRQGMAGATVLRGLEGFGAHGHQHTAKVLRLAENLPLVIEIIDSEQKISAFLPLLNDWIGEGLATIENVRVIVHRRAGQAPPAEERRKTINDES